MPLAGFVLLAGRWFDVVVVGITNSDAFTPAECRTHEQVVEQPDDFGIALKRLSQPARLVLFHARMAVSSPATAVEPEHILLGVLRYDRTFIACHLEPDWPTEELDVTLIQQLALAGPVVPEHIDVPLSPAVRALIARSVVIADELGSKNLELDHLLIALVEDQASRAAQLLRNAGATPDSIRARLTRRHGSA